MSDYRLILGDAITVMRTLPAGSCQVCVTSPPYLNLRSYLADDHPDKALEIGTEETPEAYVARLVEVFREVRRILHPSGVVFLNLGDSFCSETVYSESLVLRHDLTDEEKNDVAMAMFGMRIDGQAEAYKDSMYTMLSSSVQSSETESRPSVLLEGFNVELLSPQRETLGEDAGKTTIAQVGSDREVGRYMRLLRRNGNGIPDDRPHKQRRRGASSATIGHEPSELSKDSQGHSQSGLSAGQVSSSVLQLQLRNRLLGILSTHSFSHDEIPDKARFAFTRRIVAKPKDALGIPWMVAFALRADGWWLRSAITWCKANPMPESVTDRCTSATEMVFMFAKSERYFYDSEAIREEASAASIARISQPNFANQTGGPKDYRNGINPSRSMRNTLENFAKNPGRNKRNWWVINSEPTPMAHFATMPTKLVEPMILAGSSAKGCCAACGSPYARVVEKIGKSMPVSERHGRVGHNGQPPQTSGWYWDGPITKATGEWAATCECNADVTACTVLDPFAGSGTTLMVANRWGRDAIGIDLNKEYIELAKKRIERGQPMLTGFAP